MPRIPLLLLAIATPLATTAYATEPATQPAVADAPKPKKICRRVVKTGSQMPFRVCMTKEEWDAQAKQNENNVERSLAGRSPTGVGSSAN